MNEWGMANKMKKKDQAKNKKKREIERRTRQDLDGNLDTVDKIGSDRHESKWKLKCSPERTRIRSGGSRPQKNKIK